MLPAFGLYTHIRANIYRSIFLVAALFCLIYLLTFAGALAGEAFAHPNWRFESLLIKAWQDLLEAAPWVTLGTAAWVAIGYFFNRSIIGMAVPGHSITREEFPKLYDMLENLCISRGMTMPRYEIMETDVPNAFASGVNESQYTITVTRGLMNLLNDDEMEAVIAHELTHIRNGDVRMMVFAMVIAGVVAFFAEMFFRYLSGYRHSRSSSSSDEKSKGGAAAAIALAALLVAVAWALSLMIRLALSRSREFLADAGAAELTKNPDAMIAALRKIEGKGEIPEAPSGVMEMCLDNPRSGFADLFSTHPSVDVRVDALVRYAGGRDVSQYETQQTGPDIAPSPDPDAASGWQGEQPPAQQQPGAANPLPSPLPFPTPQNPFPPFMQSGKLRKTKSPWGGSK